MTTGTIDLEQLLGKMAARDEMRTEANVQSGLHAFLLAAPLALEDHHLKNIVLEQQAGERRRIDVEAGLCVFEVKRDLRVGNVRTDAELQLAGYVRARTEAMQQRYVGVLTDGAEWRLYHLEGTTLRLVNSLMVDAAKPATDALCVWLESVLSTATDIKPTPHEIEQRLGASSAGHALDFTDLSALYSVHRDLPTVKLKRELWARLLTTAYGTGFKDRDDLFVEHTLLVATAEIIAHCVMQMDPTAPTVSAISVMTGQLFASAEVHGVVEADFFDWVIEVPGGERFVRTLARRLKRFAWEDVEHDVLKVLYESVISALQRKQLGEYYTPDWLAEQVVAATVTDPLAQRVLDPSCGSGTFLFHAIRRFLDAAAANGLPNRKALTELTSKIVGMDIHPVAVTFARVTYLLAIGPARLRAEGRPPLSIPVYLGDSIQWGNERERDLFSDNTLVIPTSGARLLPSDDLRFPSRAIGDAAQFDRLVADLADLARKPTKGKAPPSPQAILKRFGATGAEEKMLTKTFQTLRELHVAGRNHIWGYYVRNLARPVWLSLPDNRVDVLVGNPPWLSFRFMTKEMQDEFRRLSEERKLWAGSAVATNQDLSALFVLRSIERYLKQDGRFAFVMPWSVLRGRQYAGFRSGLYPLKQDQKGLRVAFSTPWDLSAVKPTFFPVPASVISGTRGDEPHRLPKKLERWSGKLAKTNVSWAVAKKTIKREEGAVREAKASDPATRSEYHGIFSQGATMVPRMLVVVEQLPSGPLGMGAGRILIESRRSKNEKEPWKRLDPLSGPIEKQFVRPMHVGDTILPFRVLKPLRAVVPWDGKRLLGVDDEHLATYPALETWWTRAEELWEQHRKSAKLSLKGRIDYHRGLSNQFSIQPIRVVYNASGMYLSAAVVMDRLAVIEHGLYWCTVNTQTHGWYLSAVLNSDALTQRVRPLQARGEHNPRHYDKYVLQVPIPKFDDENPRHLRLAKLGEAAEKLAASVDLPAGKRFETLRRMIRKAIAESETGMKIETEVVALLGSAS